MRITILTGPWLPVPALRGGAVPRLWQGLAEEFALRGHDICIFARAFPGQPPEEVIQGVKYRRWGGFQQSLSIGKDLMKDFIYSSLVVGCLPHADILITNSFWMPVFAGFFQTTTRKIVINANRFPKGQYWLYFRSARVAAASNAICNAIVQQTPRLATRTKVFPNPVDINVFSPPPQPRGRSQSKTLLFVGRIHPEKGVHLLIEAFKRVIAHHSDWRLFLVGPTEESQGGGGVSYQQHLRGLIKEAPVEFSGPIYDVPKLAQIYRSADLFCYPSLAEKGESFGVAPLEAMATGLAPLVSNLACFNDFIQDNETGFYFDHRVADPVPELAFRLEQIMNNRQRMLLIGENAARFAQRFSFARIAEEYLTDFETLLAGVA